MARAGRKDRGLIQRKTAQGKLVWYVRLFHEGRIRWFGSFPTKTAARQFYEKSKLEQAEGRFFPERHQRGGSAKLIDVIENYMATNTNKTAKQDRYYADFWKGWFAGATLKTVTSDAIEKAKLHLSQKRVGKKEDRLLTPQTVFHY